MIALFIPGKLTPHSGFDPSVEVNNYVREKVTGEIFSVALLPNFHYLNIIDFTDF
jgi:hypothetical protein